MAASIPELNTRADCLRYVRKVCGEMAVIEHDHEAVRRQAEAEGNEVALVKLHREMNGLRDTTADLLVEVMSRMARLPAEA